MGYIEKEKVAQIRNEIKRTFPQFKFSVTWEHYSTVNIRITEGPLSICSEDHINPYHLEYIKNPQLKELSKKILEIVQSIAPVSYQETGDYGNQPNYYWHLNVGKWNKPYKQTGVINDRITN